MKNNAFIKICSEQEASSLLSSLGITKLLSEIPLVGPLLEYQQVNSRCNMKKIVNKFLLAGDKFMPKMHL